MAEVAKFCRARQAVCHRATPVPQVALLYSTAAHYRKSARLFAPYGGELNSLKGVLQCLLEGQNSVEVLSEHHLTGRMAGYPLIVVPEWEYLEPTFKDELVAYVKAGGSLLLVGPKTAALFQAELDFAPEGEPKPDVQIYLAHDGGRIAHKCLMQDVKLGPKARPFGQFYTTDAPGSPAQPAASITELGRGRIATTFFNVGQNYRNASDEVTRGFLNDLAHQLFAKPLVEVKGAPYVDVVVNRQGDKLAVNLVNTAGPHKTKPILDSVPPVGPLQITIRMEKKPASVTLEPGGQPLAFEHRDGETHLTLPKLEIHSVIAVQ